MATSSAAAPPSEAGPSSINGSINGEQARPGPTSKRIKLDPHDPSLEPMEDVLHRRLTKIKEGDNVLLRMPSDTVKAVVASKEGLVSLGKFGAFPAESLIGLHYDITYEIHSTSEAAATQPTGSTEGETARFGQSKNRRPGKEHPGDGKGKGKGNKKGGDVRSNPGWSNTLRPLRRQEVVDAIIEDITETNEFIDDSEDVRQALLSQDEIEALRAQGITGEAMIKAQLERHEQFDLKTDFSKEKWRKRKEKKYLRTIHPISPSSYNIANHYFARNPVQILSLRTDTLSQLLVLANIRPEGRYMVVDDTGGLVTAAIMERMGCDGRIMVLTDADSPPDWGVLNVMNFGERELSCVKWLTWLEAEEDYKRPPPPDEVDMPKASDVKRMAKQRRYRNQVIELNETRNELHTGNFDGLILATELNPISILARLSPYLLGSGLATIYSPYVQVLAETLRHCRHNPQFLNANLTESFTRTYQVLPGRTHPTMTTSATGGYLLQATKARPLDGSGSRGAGWAQRASGSQMERTADSSRFVSPYDPDANQYKKRKDQRAANAQRKKARAEAEKRGEGGEGRKDEQENEAADEDLSEDEEADEKEDEREI